VPSPWAPRHPDPWALVATARRRRPADEESPHFGRGHTLQETRRAAWALDVQLHVLEARHPHAFERAFEAATQAGAGALLIESASAVFQLL
jgi:hypothetical protein